MHRDYPKGLREIAVSELTDDQYQDTQLKLLFAIRQECLRQNRLLYDYSRPIDETFDAPDPIVAGEYPIQKAFDTPCMITGIMASLPIGVTSAVLRLGRERNIILYSSTAAAAQTLVNLPHLGMVLTENDERTITLAGTMTTGVHVALSGYVMERYGNR